MADPIYYYPKLTNVGAAAAFNADDNGLELTIDSVTFGAGVYDPDGTETAVQIPLATVEIAGGTRVTPTQIRLITVWDDPDAAASITEVGYWSGSVLVYIWSRSAGGPIGIKTQGVDFVLFHDLAFTQVPANSINVEVNPDLNQALAALASHEGANNAHPQYLLRSGFLNAHSLMTAVTVTGSTNDIALTLPVETIVTQYQAGQQFVFVASGTNTGSVTVNVNGLGAKLVIKNGIAPLGAGDIINGSVYTLFYDGIKMQLSAGVSGGGSVQKFEYIAEESQTLFAANYLPGNIFPFVNGRSLGSNDFIATNGTSVTITSPALVFGDHVLLVAFKSFSVPDAYRIEEVDQLLEDLEIPIEQVSNSTLSGQNLVKSPVPSSTVYPRLNADGSISYLSPAATISDIGADNASNLIAGTLPIARLPFTPVQQGGGVGQTTDKVYVGWSAGSKLKATVNSTDLGNVAFESWAGNASNLTSGTIDPARLPASSETAPGSAANATIGEVNAGIVDNKYVSPYKLRFGFSYSIGTTGFIKFPSWLGGYKRVWGSYTIGGTTTVTIPNLFENGCFNVQATLSTTTDTDQRAPKVIPFGTGIQIRNADSTPGTVFYSADGH